MAVLDMYDKVTNALHKGKYTVGVFIDFSRAFDTINHEILLRKLNHIGMRGIPLAFLKRYFYHRKQFVSVYNSKSQNINCGAPQGSIL